MFVNTAIRIFRRALCADAFVASCSFRALARVIRYNKEMLGKHMWKFPAPFLMNTVHFTIQAVASRTIVWFQHRGLEGGARKMTWKDYILRGG